MNSDLMGLAELSQFLGARHISFSDNCEPKVSEPKVSEPKVRGFSSVAIDSRDVKDGGLFFALKGASCDGHSFVTEAFSAGANCAVVESSKLESLDLVNTAQKMGKDLIVVENTLKGLQDSARVYLDKFPKLLKIGITGSSGKTTTKEITAAIIASEKSTVMNKGNLNSETGLPLSVFEVRAHHEVGVFEIGTGKTGEISGSASVLKPNITLVTNIGTAHIEYFGSKDKILEEKKCIFKFLKDSDIALIPKDDECAKKLADGVTGNIRFYGEDSFDELEGSRDLGLEGSEIMWAGEKIRFALPGKHSLQDAIAAIAIAKEVPVSNNAVKQGLESVKPLFGRLEILKGRTTVIRDCYNANPESTAKSIEFCDTADWNGRRVYVIGDMLELGETSVSAHAHIGEILAGSKAQKVFLFGKEVEAAANRLADSGKDFVRTNDMAELSASLNSYVQTTDLVLLKGSRGCALERLTEMLTEVNNVS